ncbi:hypothetical protein [Streptomyces pseudogriseolus]|uniref:hypothetical protein n=1 Tax=Streptomyces pseudogriseolus TaxID=36817 RepID=UPI003FA20484
MIVTALDGAGQEAGASSVPASPGTRGTANPLWRSGTEGTSPALRTPDTLFVAALDGVPYALGNGHGTVLTGL